MSDEKPREFWVWLNPELYSNDLRKYDAYNKQPDFNADKIPFLRVIEYSALSAKQTIIDQAEKAVEVLFSEKIKSMKERDEARAEIERLRASMTTRTEERIIIEKLRESVRVHADVADNQARCLTAARAQVGVLRKALEEVETYLAGSMHYLKMYPEPVRSNEGKAYDIAREALRATEGGADSMHKSNPPDPQDR